MKSFSILVSFGSIYAAPKPETETTKPWPVPPLHMALGSPLGPLGVSASAPGHSGLFCLPLELKLPSFGLANGLVDLIHAS